MSFPSQAKGHVILRSDKGSCHFKVRDMVMSFKVMVMSLKIMVMSLEIMVMSSKVGVMSFRGQGQGHVI